MTAGRLQLRRILRILQKKNALGGLHAGVRLGEGLPHIPRNERFLTRKVRVSRIAKGARKGLKGLKGLEEPSKRLVNYCQ